jgi:hypothetical protein
VPSKSRIAIRFGLDEATGCLQKNSRMNGVSLQGLLIFHRKAWNNSNEKTIRIIFFEKFMPIFEKNL